MKKSIGISFTKTKFEYYWNWISANQLGDDLELIELSYERENTEDFYRCDGFILTGGIDADPSYYNGSFEYPNMPETFSPERDQFEEKIFRFSKLHRLPLLGICRGLQLVNVMQGGGMIQDLGVEGNGLHRATEKGDRIHSIEVLPGTLLYDIVKQKKGTVNSAHHQAVDEGSLGKNLKANAWSGDHSVVEGLEFADKTDLAFMLCVEWHPERMENKDESVFSNAIRQRFLEAVRDTRIIKQAIINPATEELIISVNEDMRLSLEEKRKLLNEGKISWKQVSLPVRVMIIKKFSDLLEKNKERLAAKLTAEAGKPLKQSRNEINGARERIKWLTEHAEKYLSDEVMNKEQGLEERIVYEPLGVVCNISAWNYPYLVGVNVFVPALLAGNAVMYKPSEYAILTGIEIEKLLKLAGVPANVFQLALGGKETGKELLNLSFDGYYFTGSYKTGQLIYEQLAPGMVPCVCEMGGKDPLYVADDIADLRQVVASTADGAFYNAGQSCCSVERIYVHEKIYDQYIDEFVKEINSWKMGSPLDDDVYIGPLTRKEQLEILNDQVKDALDKGARLVAGGKKENGKGWFFPATVLVDVNHSMKVMRDESFGPIIGIMKVSNDEESIRLMQDSEYGLTAAVYSSDQQRAENILHQVNAGSGYWNCCDRVSAALPWGGRKQSGFGVSLSHAGLRAFTKPKSLHLRGTQP